MNQADCPQREVDELLPMQLLIVDDDAVDRRIVRRALDEGRVERPVAIAEAETGREALDLLQTREFDCVLLDYQLPDLDGLELLARLSDSPDRARVPVVMLTGASDLGIAVEAMRRGARDYLVKDTEARYQTLIPTIISRIYQDEQARRAHRRATEQLRETELRYRSLVEHIPAISYVVALGESQDLLFVSPQIRQLGHEPSVWQEDPTLFRRHIHPEDLPAARQAWGAMRRTGQPHDHEYRFVCDNGTIRWLRDQAVVVRNELSGGFIQGILTDITERRAVDAELAAYRQRLEELVAERTDALQVANRRLSEDIRRRQRVERALFAEKQRAQITLRAIGDAVITVDADGKVEYLNPAAESLLTVPGPHAKGRPLTEILPVAPLSEAAADNLVDGLACGEVAQMDARLLLSRDDERVLALSSTAICDSDGMPAGAVVVFRDVTEERVRSARLSHQARHDPLTGLPNRAEFERRLANAFDSLRAHGAHHVIVFIDLDGFKRVNDTGGHAAGDELLRQLGRTMAANIRHRDTLARMGGDEFACLIEHCELDQGVDIARALLNAVRDFSLIWEGQRFQVGASIGVVPLDDPVVGLADAMQAADAACYAVKTAGRNDLRVGRPGGEAPVATGEGWSNTLSNALASDNFELVAQPIARMSDGRIHSYEVLLRLKQEDQMIAAAAFMPAAERHRLAAEIDRWVVRHTLAALAEQIQGQGDGPQPVYFINVCSASLIEGRLIDDIDSGLRTSGVPPEQVGFEISEDAAMTHFVEAAEFARQVKALGCQLSLDDFADALPAAHNLKKLGFNLIKISGRIIAQLDDDAVSAAMIDAINRVSHAMGVATVAKFPANAEALDMARTLGIDHVQGNLVSTPQPLLQLVV